MRAVTGLATHSHRRASTRCRRTRRRSLESAPDKHAGPSGRVAQSQDALFDSPEHSSRTLTRAPASTARLRYSRKFHSTEEIRLYDVLVNWHMRVHEGVVLIGIRGPQLIVGEPQPKAVGIDLGAVGQQ